MPLRETADDSYTWIEPRFGVPYHSLRGAVRESEHVFLKSGWIPAFCMHQTEHDSAESPPFFAFEMGWGTGLNAALVAHWMEQNAPQAPWEYTALEAYPLSEAEEQSYWEALASKNPEAGAWRNALIRAREKGRIRMIHAELQAWLEQADDSPLSYRLFLYDAFAPASQPELWTEAVWRALGQRAAPRALWVSYCAKGSVVRALKSAGWFPERLPGPPGKRQMLRAWHSGPDRRRVDRVYGLLFQNKSVLVARERFKGQHLIKFPGGGVESGETQMEAIQREWREELDVSISVCERFWSALHPVQSAFDASVDVVVHYYRITMDPETRNRLPVVPWEAVFPEEDSEVPLISWVAVRDLESIPFTFAADQTVARLIHRRSE